MTSEICFYNEEWKKPKKKNIIMIRSKLLSIHNHLVFRINYRLKWNSIFKNSLFRSSEWKKKIVTNRLNWSRAMIRNNIVTCEHVSINGRDYKYPVPTHHLRRCSTNLSFARQWFLRHVSIIFSPKSVEFYFQYSVSLIHT